MFERMLPEGFIVECGDPRCAQVTLLDTERSLIEGSIEKRRREFSMGRHCARLALARLGVAEIAILAGTKREPVWPSGIVGSITHTDGFCAAAVGPASRFLGVGIDVELAEPLDRQTAIAVASDSEANRLSALDPGLAARLVFSAKESFYKCQFYHTRHWLDFFDVVIELEEQGEFSASLLVDALPLCRGLSIRGRWAVREGLLFTAIWLPWAA
ncbi:MAG TPA: 4'-phosphopantetheinyl transferase superfamily protein [Polyangiaceae bacterium]